jgi:hypothetical protein
MASTEKNDRRVTPTRLQVAIINWLIFAINLEEVFGQLCIALQQPLHQSAVSTNSESGEECFQEVVQLFTALSSGFDPIKNREDGSEVIMEVPSVKKAIFCVRWSWTQNSFQYLESLFSTQKRSTADPWNLTNHESSIAMLHPMKQSPSVAGHSRMTRKSNNTKGEGKVPFGHGSTNRALCSVPRAKTNEPETLILETQQEESYFTASPGSSQNFRENNGLIFDSQNELRYQEMEWEYTTLQNLCPESTSRPPAAEVDSQVRTESCQS